MTCTVDGIVPNCVLGPCRVYPTDQPRHFGCGDLKGTAPNSPKGRGERRGASGAAGVLSAHNGNRFLRCWHSREAERERERAMEARGWDEAATAGTEGDKWPERKEAACLMHNPHETVFTKLQIPSSLPVPFWKVLIV